MFFTFGCKRVDQILSRHSKEANQAQIAANACFWRFLQDGYLAIVLQGERLIVIVLQNGRLFLNSDKGKDGSRASLVQMGRLLCKILYDSRKSLQDDA